MRYAGIDVNRNNVVLAMEVPLGNLIFHVFDRNSRSLVRQLVEYLRINQVSHLSFEDLSLFSSIKMNYVDRNTVMENLNNLRRMYDESSRRYEKYARHLYNFARIFMLLGFSFAVVLLIGVIEAFQWFR